MDLLKRLKRAFSGAEAPPADSVPVTARRKTEPEDARVPEVTAGELTVELANGNGRDVFLLDCREPYERRMGHIPDALHIPMNAIPQRLAEIDRDADIIVYCAHGNRSYGVAGWLIQQGYRARSLKGGIADWQARGGQVVRPR